MGQRSITFAFDATLLQGRFLRLDLLRVARFMRYNAAERLMSQLSELPWEGLERFLQQTNPLGGRVGSGATAQAAHLQGVRGVVALVLSFEIPRQQLL